MSIEETIDSTSIHLTVCHCRGYFFYPPAAFKDADNLVWASATFSLLTPHISLATVMGCALLSDGDNHKRGNFIPVAATVAEVRGFLPAGSINQ